MASRTGISDEGQKRYRIGPAFSFGRWYRRRFARFALPAEVRTLQDRMRRWLGTSAAAERTGLGQPWLVALALPVLGLVAASEFELRNAVDGERAGVLRTAELLTAEVDHTIEAEGAVLAAVDASLAGLSWQQIRSRSNVQPLLADLAAASNAMETISLIDPNGLVAAASTTAQTHSIDASDRDFVRVYHDPGPPPALFVSAPVTSRFDGRFVSHLARPRYGTDPTVSGFDGGVIVAGMRPEVFERLFAQMAGATRTRITLLRKDGALLARVPQRLKSGESVQFPDRDPAWPILHKATGQPATLDIPLATVDGSLLRGIHITAVAAVPGVPLLVLIQGDPALVFDNWFAGMLFPTIGAVSTMLLLMMLGTQARRAMRGERERSALRLASLQASQHMAQQRAELEVRLRQTEKSAALGQLSAGVAHDFNNLLHAVLIGTDGLRRSAGTRPQTAEVQRAVNLIERTAERGVALTRRMLDFARRDDTPDGSSFDPAKALRQAMELLTHSFGQTWPVGLTMPATSLPPIAGDSATFETVVINLAVNARDSMPRGGRIELTAELEPAEFGPVLLSGSPAIRITVRDSGMGMDPATLARAGEAFFTTKAVGAGTGLGLSMARGFAQRVGGLLEIASEPGVGTTITLRLPIAAA